VSCPTGCYRQSPDLRLRPVHELQTCLVFEPTKPKLYMLNLSAWLILELCPGRSPDELATAFRNAVVPAVAADEAERQLEAGLDLLTRHRLIELSPDVRAA
jgi:hypothetical protein